MISENNKAAQQLLNGNGGLFQQFEWQPDEYGTEKKFLVSEKKKREEKVFDVHDRSFNPA